MAIFIFSSLHFFKKISVKISHESQHVRSLAETLLVNIQNVIKPSLINNQNEIVKIKVMEINRIEMMVVKLYITCLLEFACVKTAKSTRNDIMKRILQKLISSVNWMIIAVVNIVMSIIIVFHWCDTPTNKIKYLICEANVH